MFGPNAFEIIKGMARMCVLILLVVAVARTA